MEGICIHKFHLTSVERTVHQSVVKSEHNDIGDLFVVQSAFSARSISISLSFIRINSDELMNTGKHQTSISSQFEAVNQFASTTSHGIEYKNFSIRCQLLTFRLLKLHPVCYMSNFNQLVILSDYLSLFAVDNCFTLDMIEFHWSLSHQNYQNYLQNLVAIKNIFITTKRSCEGLLCFHKLYHGLTFIR